jgi:hypothetical protein
MAHSFKRLVELPVDFVSCRLIALNLRGILKVQIGYGRCYLAEKRKHAISSLVMLKTSITPPSAGRQCISLSPLNESIILSTI